MARVIGLAPGQEFELTDQSLYQPLESMTVEESLHRAYSSRSDYQAAMAEVHAAEFSRGAAVAGYFPSLSFNGDFHFPMMSVCKFTQALTLLHMMDEGKIPMDEKLHFDEADMHKPTRSTLSKDHSEVPFDLTIPEVLSYSIGQSDNIRRRILQMNDVCPSDCARQVFVGALAKLDRLVL